MNPQSLGFLAGSVSSGYFVSYSCKDNIGNAATGYHQEPSADQSEKAALMTPNERRGFCFSAVAKGSRGKKK